MRRRVASVLLALSVGVAMLAGQALAGDACPEGAIAQDSVRVETEFGDFVVEVCVTHNLVEREHEYMVTVANVDIECKLQSFGVTPFPGVSAELEQSGRWQPGSEEYFWIWDGPSSQAIEPGASRSFSFCIPDATPIASLSGAVFTNPSSPCGGNQLGFAMEGAAAASDPDEGVDSEERHVYGQLCQCAGEATAFPEAQRISVPSGYRAEYVVAPSGLNVPSDVAISRHGTIYVTSSRAGAIYRVNLDGSIQRFASSHAYAIDLDHTGRLYGYNYPAGEVISYTSSGKGNVIARFRQTMCESTLAAAPDGTLYIALNYCMGDEMGDATLYRLRGEDYKVETVLEGVPYIASLDVGSDGKVYAVVDGVLSAIDAETGTVTALGELGREISQHGLAVSEDGEIFLSSGTAAPEGAVYRFMTGSTELVEVAAFRGNGIQGIAIHPDGSLIGVQRGIGGLQRIAPDGTTSAIVEPNGLVSPQAICSTPCGELVVVNDEAGWASIVCPDGTVHPFVRMTSFIPPLTYIASSEDGWIVAGESAPGFPSELVRYEASGKHAILATDIYDVSGVAVAPDGSIYAAATREDRVWILSPDGTREVLTTNVRKPQALALSEDGRLYAIANRETSDDFESSMYGDTVVEILASGSVRLLEEIAYCTDLAIDEGGTIYVATEEEIWRIDKHGGRSIFASGFDGARGVAFLDGHLHVTDDVANAIIRIVRTGSGTD